MNFNCCSAPVLNVFHSCGRRHCEIQFLSMFWQVLRFLKVSHTSTVCLRENSYTWGLNLNFYSIVFHFIELLVEIVGRTIWRGSMYVLNWWSCRVLNVTSLSWNFNLCKCCRCVSRELLRFHHRPQHKIQRPMVHLSPQSRTSCWRASQQWKTVNGSEAAKPNEIGCKLPGLHWINHPWSCWIECVCYTLNVWRRLWG